MRKCFDSLDEKKIGKIGVDELEDPLIGLGFAESREEVIYPCIYYKIKCRIHKALLQIKDLIDAVDDDGSGTIEFKEFLNVVKGTDGDEKSQKIYEFFKSKELFSFSNTLDMTKPSEKKSKISASSNQELLPFNLKVCIQRRKKLLVNG